MCSHCLGCDMTLVSLLGCFQCPECGLVSSYARMETYGLSVSIQIEMWHILVDVMQVAPYAKEECILYVVFWINNLPNVCCGHNLYRLGSRHTILLVMTRRSRKYTCIILATCILFQRVKCCSVKFIRLCVSVLVFTRQSEIRPEIQLILNDNISGVCHHATTTKLMGLSHIFKRANSYVVLPLQLNIL